LDSIEHPGDHPLVVVTSDRIDEGFDVLGVEVHQEVDIVGGTGFSVHGARQ